MAVEGEEVEVAGSVLHKDGPTWVCQASCDCPADGGSCVVGDACLPGTLVCKPGSALVKGICVAGAAPRPLVRHSGFGFFGALFFMALGVGLAVGMAVAHKNYGHHLPLVTTGLGARRPGPGYEDLATGDF